MIVYLVAALVAAFYLGAVPLNVAVEIMPGEEGKPRMFFGIFGRVRTWTRLIDLRMPDFSRPRKKMPGELIRAARYLLKRTRVDVLRARLSAGDACRTALLTGFVQAALFLISRRARIVPVFSSPKAELGALCIVTIHLGHIILAALYGAWIWIGWRISTWTKGRLKALWPPRWNPFATWWTSTP